MKIINDAGKLAGSLSAILTLLVHVLFNLIKMRNKEKRDERRHKEQARLDAEENERKAAEDFRNEILEAVKSIGDTLITLTDDIGDLQYEHLSQVQEFYTQQGWCPGSKKEMLCPMHKSYRAKGKNHLSEHYEEEILRLDSQPHP